VLADDPAAHQTPSIEELQAWEEAQAEDVRQQMAASEAKVNALASSEKNKSQSEEAQRKRKEREKKRAEALAAAAAAAGADAPQGGLSSLLTEVTIGGDSNGGPESTPTSKRANEPHTVALPPHTITVHGQSNGILSWYRTSGTVYESIADARAAGVWNYPTSLQERAQCGVFRDLWEKGYFMGIGIKFGGNYLVYPGVYIPLVFVPRNTFLMHETNRLTFSGDPLRYHSHFVATVLDSPTSTLRPMEIVAHGRLGTATKKAHLLCGWDDESGQVSYYSIEWAGFG
jgi:tRNA-splicing endonuclease subunit Sen34